MGRHKTHTSQKLERNKCIHEHLADVLRIPEEAIRCEIKATITSNSRVWVENYLCILEFTEEKICLRGKSLNLIVEGTGLKIDYLTKEDMLIRGNLTNVKYQAK